MSNIEIKARYSDLEKARRIASRLKADTIGMLRQVDTYFKTRSGRLKLREFGDGTAQLIPYAKDYRSGPMRSDYVLLATNQPEPVKALFDRLLGIEFVVDKRREVFLIDNVRVHLDRVEGLGNFLEFEAVVALDTAEEMARETEKVNELMREFDIAGADLIDCSYVDLLSRNE